MENIILASQSPRRQEILSLGGYEYKVCVSSAEEQIPPEELDNLTPQELVERLARVKAEDVFRRNCIFRPEDPGRCREVYPGHRRGLFERGWTAFVKNLSRFERKIIKSYNKKM